MRYICLFFLIGICGQLLAQQSAYEMKDLSQNKIKERRGYSVQYVQGEAASRCLQSRELFDSRGHLVEYVEHYDCGKMLTKFSYAYDNTGKLTNGTLTFLTETAPVRPFAFKYDAQGRVIDKIISMPEKKFFQSEHITYDQQGNITQIEYQDEQGNIQPGIGTIKHRYENGRLAEYYFQLPKTDQLSRVKYMYDSRGLVIETQWYTGMTLTQTITYEYFVR